MKKFLILAWLGGWFFSLLCLPKPAQALAPIDQDCQYSIAPNSPYTFLSHLPGQVLMPTRNTLDAIAVYIKTDIGGTSQVKADFLSATDTSVQTIASKTQTIDSTAQWVTFDFPDVAIPHPYGIIQLTQADSNHAVWYQCPQASYTRGNGVTEGTNPGYNYRFAVYTYDAADPNNPSGSSSSSTDSGIASDTSDTTATSSDATADQPPGSSKKSGTTSTGKAKTTTATTAAPNTDALLKSLKEEQQSSGKGGVLPMILFFLVRAAIPLFLLFLFFVACLVGLILFIRSRKKKTAPIAPAPVSPPPEEKTPKPESKKL